MYKKIKGLIKKRISYTSFGFCKTAQVVTLNGSLCPQLQMMIDRPLEDVVL